MIKPKKNIPVLRNHYEAQNRAAAQAILEQPEQYAGGLLEWAQMFMANHPALAG